VRGGSFISNVPERCDLALNTTYLPGDADSEGYGSVPRGEIERAVAEAAAADDWLAANPPTWSWYTDYPPSEIDPETAIVSVVREAGRELGVDVRPEGIDTTYDGALLSLFADTPSPAFGPGDLARAHAPDEWISIDELLLGARLYSRAIVAWCGTEAV
jgi:acetylornithine deacetylase